MNKAIQHLELNQFLKRKKITDDVLKTLSLVLDSMAEGVNVSNDKGIILFTNPAFDAMFGYNQGELIGKHVSDLNTYSPEENAQIYKQISNFMDEQKVWSGEFSNKKRDSTVFYTEARINAMKLRGKRCLISVQSDITERKRMEKALRASETKYRIVSDNTYDWGYWINPDRKLLYISPSCKRITGYDIEEFLADPNLIYSIIHPKDQPFFATHRAEAEKKLFSDEVEFRIIRKDGTLRWIGHVCQPVFDSDRNFLGTRASNRDLTKRKLAEDEVKKMSEELARSNADLKQFAYVASHDLKEPLLSIAGFSKRLEKKYKDNLDEKADEYIDYIIDGVKRMEILIKDLLEYSQVETNGKTLMPTNCSVALEKAIFNLQSAVEKSKAKVTYDPLPTVSADTSQLSQLFQNLIGNAIKFRDRKPPEIHISAKQQGEEWIFSVKDNGIGIAPGNFERIFTIFQRLHTGEEYEGTGMGLAICKKIVERHGGRIWIESEPEEGSTFYFTLPRRELPA